MRKEKLDSCSDGGLPRMQVLHTCICPEYRFYIPAGCFEDLKERRKFYFLVLLGVFLRTATAIIVFTVFFYKKIEELKSWKTGVFFGKNRDSCSLLFEGNVCVTSCSKSENEYLYIFISEKYSSFFNIIK